MARHFGRDWCLVALEEGWPALSFAWASLHGAIDEASSSGQFALELRLAAEHDRIEDLVKREGERRFDEALADDGLPVDSYHQDLIDTFSGLPTVFIIMESAFIDRWNETESQ